MYLIVENNIITTIFNTLENVDVNPTSTPNLVGYFGTNEVQVGYFFNNGNPSPTEG